MPVPVTVCIKCNLQYSIGVKPWVKAGVDKVDILKEVLKEIGRPAFEGCCPDCLKNPKLTG